MQGMMQAMHGNMMAMQQDMFQMQRRMQSDMGEMHRQMHNQMGNMHNKLGHMHRGLEADRFAHAGARSARDHARQQRQEAQRAARNARDNAREQRQEAQRISREHREEMRQRAWHARDMHRERAWQQYTPSEHAGYPPQRQGIYTSVVNGDVYVNDEFVARCPPGGPVAIDSSGGVVRLNGRIIWTSDGGRLGGASLPLEGVSEVEQPLAEMPDHALPHRGARRAADDAERIALRSSRAGISPIDHEETCSVCLDEIKAGQQIRTLPCFHFLHRHCAEAHFARPSVLEPGTAPQVVCPVCRVKVAPESADVDIMSI